MHLQDAYYAEKNETGDGDQIGYKKPASTVFDYAVTGGGAANAVFTATSQTGLDECSENSTWTVESSKGSKGGAVHEAKVNGDNCEPLTPSFTTIGAGTL